jgi:hypothetical protein
LCVFISTIELLVGRDDTTRNDQKTVNRGLRRKIMDAFNSDEGQAPTYFLVKKGNRVEIKTAPSSEVKDREVIGKGFESREMAEAALEDYLGDERVT